MAMMTTTALSTLKGTAREQHKRRRHAPLDPLLGLHFRNVLGDALRDERRLARCLSRLVRECSRHSFRPELVNEL
jgi:hypothetical protein